MNAKEKLILMIAGGVSGVIMLALCALIFIKYGDMVDARDLRDRNKSSLDECNSKPIYPSDANIQIVKDNQKTLQAWIDNATQMVCSSTVDFCPRGEKFLNITEDRLAEVIRSNVNRLNALQNFKSTELSGADKPQMDFGFDKYVTNAEPIERVNAPRIARQFHAIETLADLFFAAKGQAITKVSRKIFEQGAQVKEETSSRSRRSRRPTAKKEESTTNELPVPEALKDHFYKEAYTFKVYADYANWVAFLNEISKLPLYIITDVKIKSQVDIPARFASILQKKENIENNAEKKTGSRSRNSRDDSIRTIDDIAVSDRVLADKGIREPLEITFSIDVYGATPPTTKKEGK